MQVNQIQFLLQTFSQFPFVLFSKADVYEMGLKFNQIQSNYDE